MEQVIGIYDEEPEYGSRLAQYINEHENIGYFGRSFTQFDELEAYLLRETPAYLLVSEELDSEKKKQLETLLTEKNRLFYLSERTGEQKDRQLYRYQKAAQMMEELFCGEQVGVREQEVICFYSPACQGMAEETAWFFAEEMAKSQRTLLLLWEPFCGMGREENRSGISDLLYYLRKKEEEKEWPFTLCEKNRVHYFAGVEYHTDLWRIDAEEMRAILQLLKEQGGYQSVIFVFSFWSEGVQEIAQTCGRLFLVNDGTETGERQSSDFIRQFRYAGNREILSVTKEVTKELLVKEFRGTEWEEVKWKK